MLLLSMPAATANNSFISWPVSRAITPISRRGNGGPPLIGLLGSQVELADGHTVTVDEDYLRESILKPNAKIVKGYAAADADL